MKNRRIGKFLNIIVFLSIIMVSGQVLGAEFAPINQKNYTQQYKKWQTLAEEEKKNTKISKKNSCICLDYYK